MRPITFPSDNFLFLVINQNHYPDTNFTIIGQQWRTINPAITPLVIEAIYPLDSRRDTSTSHHGTENTFTLFA